MRTLLTCAVLSLALTACSAEAKRGGYGNNGKKPIKVEPPTEVVVPNVAVSWTAPLYNVDGTPLTDLVGYRVHYNNNVVDVGNVTSYVIDGLSADVIYTICVTAYTAHAVSECSDSREIILN